MKKKNNINMISYKTKIIFLIIFYEDLKILELFQNFNYCNKIIK